MVSLLRNLVGAGEGAFRQPRSWRGGALCAPSLDALNFVLHEASGVVLRALSRLMLTGSARARPS
jgi:hypothetical protein